MHPLESSTLDIINRDQLIPTGSTVVTGVSAGADSVGLLVVLAQLADALNISPVAVYVDHGLRLGETEEEKEYVAHLAERLRTGFDTVVVPVEEYAKKRKISLEHAARDLRYGALRQIAERYKLSVIATAHTAEDQAEEVLIRLIRGGGRKGLSGMRTKNGDIVRPFLETGKSDILGYLMEKDIGYLEDSTNSDPRFLRNRVRHELIPFLEQHFDPGIKNALRKTAHNLAQDENLLEELTENALLKVSRYAAEMKEKSPSKMLLDRVELIKLPVALQRRVVERLLWQIGGKARFNHIVKVVDAAREGRTGSEIHLSEGLRVGIQRKYIEFVYPEGKSSWRGRLYPGKV